MKAWLTHHLRAFKGTWLRFGRAPFATLFNIVVIGIALALPVALYTVIYNIQSWAQHLPADPQITLFLTSDASRTDVADIEQRLKRRADVKKTVYVSRDQALEALKRSTGLTDVLQGLEHNPLPDAFVVEAKDASAEALEPLRGELAQWPKVERAQLDSVWAKRLEAVLRTARIAVFALATLLAFALVAVTFNTIRLQILTRRADIEVAQLFGATNAFIRRPFLYDGAFLGALGGLAGCGLVALTVALLNRELAPLSDLYGVLVAMRPVALPDLLAVLGLATVLGWLGAWLSVGQHLASGATR
ncbi:MAG TPA: permease-like cell division protein FtsX [Burkholderiales bacterium]